jgi:nitrite reductase/ring-hydroxylating ferredoxin subunit
VALDIREETTLTEGSALQDCVDLEGRRVKAKVFADPAIHRLELRRVFARTWNFVGFESEIPAVGSYVTRRIGGDSVLVSRDKTGVVNVLLNSCTHRGTQLSVLDEGTCDRFRCPYHGWVFDTAGRLEAMVAQRERLGVNGCTEAFDLRRARVARYHGLLFATWDEDLPDFETYLGELRWYFDILFASTEEGLCAAGPPQRWNIRCDWKLGAENHAGDAYHAPSAHASATDIGLVPPGFLTNVLGATHVADTTYGHGALVVNLPRILGFDLEDEVLRAFQLPWLSPELLSQVDRLLSADQMRFLRSGFAPGPGNVFPNFSWVMQATPLGPLCTVRTWQPISPGHVELWSWAVVHPAVPEEQRSVGSTGYTQQFGMSGLLEQNDAVVWERIQRAREGAIGGEQYVDYSCARVPNQGAGVGDDEDWPGPGTVWHAGPGPGGAADDAMWNFIRRWYDLMTAA